MKSQPRLVAGQSPWPILSSLPRLPAHARYVDEYDDTVRTVRRLSDEDVWTIEFDTYERKLDFGRFLDPAIKHAAKWLVCWGLQQCSPRTVAKVFESAIRLHAERGPEWFAELFEREPDQWGAYWDVTLRPSLRVNDASFVKSALYLLCDMRMGAWNPGYEALVRSLRWPVGVDAYKGVLSGESLLTTQEETAIVGFLDDTAAEAKRRSDLPERTLLRHCLLAICYEHALRPVQIARIALSDLRVNRGLHDEPIVHFTAHRAKKRDGKDRVAFVRRIKREWAAPFAHWHALRSSETDGIALTESVKAFPHDLAAIIVEIGDATKAITGTRRTATDYRHSAAQRLADAGASVEEVAHFLGHSDLETSLVYFEQSAAQAEQVNRALAISPVYGPLANIARTKTIDKTSLFQLAPDNQIGAVPHGIPVSGIGACNLGQHLCDLNPALSCYTCRKFIPVADAEMHRKVLDDFRKVARFFFDESRGDNQSPAFAQLRITLTAIQKVIDDIDEGHSNQENTHG